MGSKTKKAPLAEKLGLNESATADEILDAARAVKAKADKVGELQAQLAAVSATNAEAASRKRAEAEQAAAIAAAKAAENRVRTSLRLKTDDVIVGVEAHELASKRLADRARLTNNPDLVNDEAAYMAETNRAQAALEPLSHEVGDLIVEGIRTHKLAAGQADALVVMAATDPKGTARILRSHGLGEVRLHQDEADAAEAILLRSGLTMETATEDNYLRALEQVEAAA